MRVLIACEYSATVREAFAARGHEALSCDLLDTEVPGPHYMGDVRDVLEDTVGGMDGVLGSDREAGQSVPVPGESRIDPRSE